MNKTELPESFLKNLQIQLGNAFPDFVKSFSEAPPTSVRLNRNKRIEDFDLQERISWASDAYYLAERRSFTLDPYFHAGSYYVQEASSMYLEQVFKQVINENKPLRVLDLCAAPGGKSTHLLSMLPEGSLLVSNEVIPSRNKILQYNIQKWGNANVIVTQNDPADFNRIPGFFDVVVVDAPCSGEGLFRKDSEAVNEWSPDNVELCSVRQHAILNEVINCLTADGVLIYSTCTYEESENDEPCDAIIHKHGLKKIALAGNEQLVTTKNGLQFYPHRIKGEGFFIAAFQKPNDGVVPRTYKQKKLSKSHQLFKTYLKLPDEFYSLIKNGELYAIHKSIAPFFEYLALNLYIRQAGIHLGSLIRDELIPSHQLALSNDINPGLPNVELNKEDAINYLRGEALSLDTKHTGWVLVKYRGFNLGWVKVLQNRINNYYPKSHRIRKMV